jgi:hypothetical protein
MMILQQDLTVLERPMVAVGLSSPTIDDRRPVLTFAVGVRAGVKRVLQYRDHVAIADRRPIQRDQLPAVRRARKMHLLAPKRQVDLTSASELAEAAEDLPNGLLHAGVRVKSQAELAMPSVADRHGDAQFAPPRLGAGGLVHARPQNALLELADAALHA